MKPKFVTSLAFIVLFLTTVESELKIPSIIVNGPISTEINQLLMDASKCISFRYLQCNDQVKSNTAVLENKELYKPEELVKSLQSPQNGSVCIHYRYVPCQQNWKSLSTIYEKDEDYLLRAYTRLFNQLKLQERERDEERNNVLQLVTLLTGEIQNVQNKLTRCQNQVNDREIEDTAEEKHYSELNATLNHQIVLCNDKSAQLNEENGILSANSTENQINQSKILALLEAEKENRVSLNKTFDEKLSISNTKNAKTTEENEILKLNLTNSQNKEAKLSNFLETEKQRIVLLTKEYETNLLFCRNRTHFTIKENQNLRENFTRCQMELEQILIELGNEIEYRLATSDAKLGEYLQTCNKKLTEVSEENKMLHSLITRLQSDQKMILSLLEDEKQRCGVTTDSLTQTMQSCYKEYDLIAAKCKVLNVTLTKALNDQKETLKLLQVEK